MRIIRIISTIKRNRNKNNVLLKLFRPYFLFFENGIYCVDSASRIIYKAKEYKKYDFEARHTFNGFLTYGKKKNRIKSFFSQIIRKKIFVVSNKHANYHNTIGIINMECDCIKLFDYKNYKVLTFYKDDEKRNHIMANRLQLSYCGYCLPRLFPSDESVKSKNGILEQLVIKKNYDFEDGFLDWINRLINSYINKSSIKTDKKIQKYRIDIIKKFLCDYCQKKTLDCFSGIIKNDEYIIRLCHGDFYPLNYIYDGERYYIIDYECVAYKYFLYDFFFFILNCYICFNNPTLLNNYFSGLYDALLDRIFKKNDILYKKRAKSLYFLISLIEIFKFKLNQDFYDTIEKISSNFKDFHL